jgi:dTMP kinase
MSSLFIGLEGIDASGKTTMSLHLEDKLNSLGIKTKRLVKKYTEYENDNLTQFTETLKKLIWGYEDDMLKSVTSQGWLYLHALWYSILTENFINSKDNNFDVIIVDGWFYKIYSRFLLKKDFDKILLNTVFNSIRKCDNVFLLNVSPQVCWSRRSCFKETEMGGYDFEITDRKMAFINYQSKVRDQLLLLSEKEGWSNINAESYTINNLTNLLASKITNIVELKEVIYDETS